MDHMKETQRIVDRILRDSKPWNVLLEFENDWALFSQKIIEDAFKERVRTKDDIVNFIHDIMSNNEIGIHQEIIGILVECMWSISFSEYHTWDFMKDILKYSHEDVLKGSIRNWFADQLEYSDSWVLTLYKILSEHPQFKKDPDLIEAMRRNPEGLSSSLYEVNNPLDELKIIADIPELLTNEEIYKAILWYLENTEYLKEDVADLKELYPFPECAEFWNRVFNLLIENKRGFWGCFEPLNLEYLLIPKYTRYNNIQDSRSALIDGIITNGWSIMRAVLLLEIITAEDDFEFQNITGDELQKTYSRFFDILGITGVVHHGIPPKEILWSIDWYNDFEQLKTDIHERTSELLEKHIESGGSSQGIEISKLKDTSASRVIPTILESREREMDDVNVIIHDESCVDLRFLWKTHYGRDYLRAKGIWQFCSVTTLKEIEKDFGKLGYNLTVIHSIGHDSNRREKFDSNFLHRIDSESAIDSIGTGLHFLRESKHPESIHIVKDLLGDGPRSFYWKNGIRNQWGAPVPLDSIIDLLKSKPSLETKKILLGLLKGWKFNSTSDLTSTYATIVQGFDNNHDNSVVKPLLKILQSMESHVVSLEAPDIVSYESDLLVMYLVDILLLYQTKGVFEELHKIYDIIYGLNSTENRGSTAYSLLQIVENGLKRSSSTTEHKILLKELFD